MKKLVKQNGCIDAKKVIENEVLVTFIDIKVFISVSIAPRSQSPSSHRLNLSGNPKELMCVIGSYEFTLKSFISTTIEQFHRLLSIPCAFMITLK